jgi:hypothetical protein
VENFIHCSAATGQGKCFAVRATSRIYSGPDFPNPSWPALMTDGDKAPVRMRYIEAKAYFLEWRAVKNRRAES